MKISVIIPFYNSQETIEKCLDALAEQYVKPDEVILVDNRSTDNSIKIVQAFKKNHTDLNIILAEETKPGPAAARNKGLKIVTGDIITFTDSDCMPAKNWLYEIKKAFSNLKFGAVAGQIVGCKPGSIFDKFHALFTMKGFTHSQTFNEFTLVRGGFPTANLSIKKTILDQISGFCDTMKIYSEDYDLCARIYRAGFCIRYTTDAIVYHRHRNNLKGTWTQSFGYGTGHSALLKKHFERLVIIDVPRYNYISKRWALRLWLDVASADKKLFVLVLLSLVWWPLFIAVAFYLLSLYENIGQRLKQNALSAGFIEKCQLILLLIFKSAAITMGRIVGSVRNKVLCC